VTDIPPRMADIGGGTPFPVRNDWLDVQSKIFRLWERRWAVLDQNKVSFHRAGKTASEPGRLAFELRCDQVVNVTGPVEPGFVIYLQTGANSGYKVRCHTAERAKDWKKDLLYRSCKKDK